MAAHVVQLENTWYAVYERVRSTRRVNGISRTSTWFVPGTVMVRCTWTRSLAAGWSGRTVQV
jgi:hypothetical protein